MRGSQSTKGVVPMRCAEWLRARSIPLLVVLAALALALEPGASAVVPSDLAKQASAIPATSAVLQTSATSSQPQSGT